MIEKDILTKNSDRLWFYLLGGKTIFLRYTWKSWVCTFLVGRFEMTNTYPLVMSNIAIENGPVEIDDFPIDNGDFP